MPAHHVNTSPLKPLESPWNLSSLQLSPLEPHQEILLLASALRVSLSLAWITTLPLMNLFFILKCVILTSILWADAKSTSSFSLDLHLSALCFGENLVKMKKKRKLGQIEWKKQATERFKGRFTYLLIFCILEGDLPTRSFFAF